MDGDSELAVLQTKNLTLSPCCPVDCDDFMDLERDPEVMRFLNGGHASRRVLEKIGLNYVRTVHVDWPDRFPGIEEGEVQYELLRKGWNTFNLV